MLTALQERVARILAELPEARDFALAGGAALIARGLIDRPTRDLDFFATSAEAVDRVLPALRQALSEEGVEVTTIRQAAGFVRLEVTDGRETSEVDLSHDARLHPAESSPLGSILSEQELAADKTLALFGRAEARDFIDVDALVDRFGRERLLELAADKDAGFTPERFAESLSAIDRLQPADFPGGEATFKRLRQQFHDWRRELTHGPMSAGSRTTQRQVGPARVGRRVWPLGRCTQRPAEDVSGDDVRRPREATGSDSGLRLTSD